VTLLGNQSDSLVSLLAFRRIENSPSRNMQKNTSTNRGFCEFYAAGNDLFAPREVLDVTDMAVERLKS